MKQEHFITGNVKPWKRLDEMQELLENDIAWG
jgi:hypothetical protein